MIEVITAAEGRTRGPTSAEEKEEKEKVADMTALTQPRQLHPYRRNPPFACHFDGLAAVEVQSIMQMIDRRSLLRLARCSRRMHSDGDSDAAWNSQPTFEIMLRAADPGIGSRIQRSLLRHLPRVYVLVTHRGTDPPADVQAMLAIPRITEITGRAFGLRAEEWLQVLSHPCTAGLTTFNVTDASLVGTLPAELAAQLACLRRLDTIVITQALTSGDLLAVLPTLSALTALSISDLSWPVDSASLLPPARHKYTRLTQLTLGKPSDDSRLFRSIFCDVQSASTAAFLWRLEYLDLEQFKSIVPHTRVGVDCRVRSDDRSASSLARQRRRSR